MTSESKAHTDFQNKSLKTDEQEDGFDSYCYECKSILKETAVCPECGQGYEWVRDGEGATLEKKVGNNPVVAHEFIEAALTHMKDRAATYDKPQGERSMGAAVSAFREITGVQMTEEQGWLFMAVLKAVRTQQGNFRSDNYEDGAAYFALAGEAACRDRK